MAKNILVIGGGITGITTAVEAAETGYNVILIEKKPYLGGNVVMMNKYFPKLCPPYCGMEINLRRIKTNNRIKCFTMTEIERISKLNGNEYEVTLRINPRFVTERCTVCGECVNACPSERPDEFNFNMNTTKAVYLPHSLAFPYRYVIDEKACQKCRACIDTCKYEAINLEMVVRHEQIKVGAIVITTGWQLYDAAKLDNLGFGKYKNVITNMMMERLSAQEGPTNGKILRLSDKKEPRSIAFVQCAGSRDENHLPYCSAVCCLASLKQITYVRDTLPECEVFMFYIDIRAFGKYEDFYMNVAKDNKVSFIKGKVADISEDNNTGELIVEAEDILSGNKIKKNVDMVVLACGMQPVLKEIDIPLEIDKDDNGFVVAKQHISGIYAAGVAKKPAEVVTCVEDATGAALKAIQNVEQQV
jgi:quinone-modifying oxidoreductase subunit QmoA